MAENRAEVLAGAVVVAVAAAFLAFAVQGRGVSTGGPSVEYRASFRSVEGIRVGTDVRLAGVKVGRITSVTLNPQTFFADTTISLPADVALPDDSAVLVSSEGLLGGAFVELHPGGSPTDYAPGDEIEDTQGAVSVISLLMKFLDSSGGNKDDAAQTNP
ncbi:outer membrane lipid asymmetry maintenance protein MlaD [Paracoccus sp. p4-l81]|uniref:outer membrane lipid asymmetry maintenance protein MlaD n=1 Tax=unclassified Paracoccus (in: a-proteobacteria) TaxID=2688777 RepID=UPI0035B6D5C3